VKVLYDAEITIGDGLKLVSLLMRRSFEQEYPALFKWSHQVIYQYGADWIKLCRIDNYPHKGHALPHVHEYGKDGVRYCKLSYDEAEDEIKRLAYRILRDRFNTYRTMY
jgi:hypothetical protein